ncbi:HpsJ family protein [Alkalinema pantanalense CENA528]|uniref:HpsJ family protein n=1 Tax=Alkalinema pantanalense TaxID=1620705 RepID=UPI003D6F0FDF
MKSATSALSAPFILKVAGSVILLSALVDYLSLLIPFQASSKEWVITTVSQSIDRGFVPLVGLVLLYVAYFLESGTLAAPGKSPFVTGRFWAIVLSCLFGLGFLFSSPAYFLNSGDLVTNRLKDISENRDRVVAQTTQEEQTLELQVQQRLGQLQDQVKDKAKLDQELKALTEAVNSGQLKGDQLEQAKKAQQDLEKLKSDPNHLNNMAKEFKEKELMRIRENRKKVEDQAKKLTDQTNTDVTKTRIRMALNSLLFAIAYTIIGWVGLAEMGIFSKPQR